MKRVVNILLVAVAMLSVCFSKSDNMQSAKAYYDSANAKSALGDYHGAIEDDNVAVAINPKYEAAYSNRGISKYELGDYHGAIEDYDKAITINPKNEDARTNKGLAYRKKAEKMLKKLLSK